MLDRIDCSILPTAREGTIMFSECGHSHWVGPVPPKRNAFQNYTQKSESGFIKNKIKEVCPNQ